MDFGFKQDTSACSFLAFWMLLKADFIWFQKFRFI